MLSGDLGPWAKACHEVIFCSSLPEGPEIMFTRIVIWTRGGVNVNSRITWNCMLFTLYVASSLVCTSIIMDKESQVKFMMVSYRSGIL